MVVTNIALIVIAYKVYESTPVVVGQIVLSSVYECLPLGKPVSKLHVCFVTGSVILLYQ